MRLLAAVQLASSARNALSHYGLRHTLRLVSIYVAEPACQAVVPWGIRAYLKQRLWRRRLLAAPAMRVWQTRWKKGLLRADYQGCATLDSLGLSADQGRALRNELLKTAEVDLGSIDQDGFLLSRFDSVTAVPR